MYAHSYSKRLPPLLLFSSPKISRPKRRQRGFTIVEITVVLFIIVALSYTSYEYMASANNEASKTQMLQRVDNLIEAIYIYNQQTRHPMGTIAGAKALSALVIPDEISACNAKIDSSITSSIQAEAGSSLTPCGGNNMKWGWSIETSGLLYLYGSGPYIASAFDAICPRLKKIFGNVTKDATKISASNINQVNNNHGDCA